MLLHYLVKIETPKMHVNTNSASNVNYKRPSNVPNYNDGFTRCSDETHNTMCPKKSHLWLVI